MCDRRTDGRTDGHAATAADDRDRANDEDKATDRNTSKIDIVELQKQSSVTEFFMFSSQI